MNKSKYNDCVLNVIKNSTCPLSAKNIYEYLKPNINIDYSTVYRCLNKMLEKKIITRITKQDTIFYYEMASKDHIHYITCDKCKKASKLTFCPISQISKDNDFEIVDHFIEIKGICKNCKK